MKERPILFSAPMVRAILEGQKTQTRRIVKPQPDLVYGSIPARFTPDDQRLGRIGEVIRCPYGDPGDRLWVKETTLKVEDHGYEGPVYAESDDGRACLSGGLAPSDDDCTEVEPWEIKLRPSIFMPRSMARILLEVVDVRVQQIQAISPNDAIAEGIERTATGDGWRRYADPKSELAGLPPCQYPRHSYRSLWELINGPMAWDNNPWVWVVEFKHLSNGD